MKLIEVKLQNFRSYFEEIVVPIDQLTVIVGRNDAGKSTLLEALDIFFNDSAIEKEDACVSGDNKDVRITCVFDELPNSLILDELHPTTLRDEHLLRSDGKLEICRVYNCSTVKGKQSRIFARCWHPSKSGTADLHGLKITELKTRANSLSVDLNGVNQTIKTAIRRAIWDQSGDLSLAEAEIDLSSEVGKDAWAQIAIHLPVYSLFKSDRTSTDQDGEAQDPMKAAIKEVVKKYECQLNEIIDDVKQELDEVARKTVEKIQEMTPELANTLDPQVKNKNWDSLFSVTLTGDEGISINKRGSGTRRLVLLNFFRAKAESDASTKNTGVIYAIEEPETSQHPNHQLLLFQAFQDLCTAGTAQILVTTHTPTLARKADRHSLRFVTRRNGRPEVLHGKDDATLTAIKETLGVLPDHDVKVFVGVEGKWDIQFLTRISRMLNAADSTIPDLSSAESSGSLIFLPLGGSSMELWTYRVANLDRPEIYITDRDEAPPKPPKYQKQLADWNARPNCVGIHTTKRELENYLHTDAIKTICPTFGHTVSDFDDVPLLVAEAIHCADPSSSPWQGLTPEKKKLKASNAKRRLNQEVVDAMTPHLLKQVDPGDEIIGWLKRIATYL